VQRLLFVVILTGILTELRLLALGDTAIPTGGAGISSSEVTSI